MRKIYLKDTMKEIRVGDLVKLEYSESRHRILEIDGEKITIDKRPEAEFLKDILKVNIDFFSVGYENIMVA